MAFAASVKGVFQPRTLGSPCAKVIAQGAVGEFEGHIRGAFRLHPGSAEIRAHMGTLDGSPIQAIRISI